MKSIEVFAGAGELGMGLHHAGFEPVNVIEWNRYCCDTIRENKSRGVAAVKRWTLTAGDVRDVDFREYENKVQLVSAGLPASLSPLVASIAPSRHARHVFRGDPRRSTSETTSVHLREREGADARKLPKLLRVYPAPNGASRDRAAEK